MTPEQLTAIKAAILASTDQAVIDARAIRNDTELARLYNLDSTFIVWRTSVPVSEYRDALVWTSVDGLTAGKARIWDWLTGGQTMPLETHKAAVRQGIADCWGAASATVLALQAVAKRTATKAEAIFTTGTGTTATPGMLVWEGKVSIADIGAAMNS